MNMSACAVVNASPGASLDDIERAAMAEIERREGYEVQLVAALEACRAICSGH